MQNLLKRLFHLLSFLKTYKLHLATWSCITYLINLGATYARNILGLVTFVSNLVIFFGSPFLVFLAKAFSNFHHFTTLFIVGCDSFSQSGKQWNPQNWHLPYTHLSLKNKTFESFGHKYNSHRLEFLLYTWWWAWQIKLPTTTPLRGLEHTLSHPHNTRFIGWIQTPMGYLHIIEAWFDFCHFLVITTITWVEILQLSHKIWLQFFEGNEVHMSLWVYNFESSV